MKISPQQSAAIQAAVEKRFGKSVRTPGHFALLATDIFNHTGQTIGISTLKRLWGYIADQTGTSFTTLSILASYAGYIDWEAFERKLQAKTDNPDKCDNSDDSDFCRSQIINTHILPIGTTVVAHWGSAKSLSIKKIAEPARFVVISAENIKLKPDDKVTIHSLANGRPLQASDCVRGTTCIGNYTGARLTGLNTIGIS